MSDFTITTTANFDAGTKTNTETSTDNPLASAGEVRIEPTFCDRISGGSRKAGWTEDVHALASADITDEIDDGNHLKIVQQLNAYAHVQRDVVLDNITIQAKLKTDDVVTASWRNLIALYWDVDNWVTIGENPNIDQHQHVKNVASTITVTNTGSSTQGTWYWYKIVITAGNYYTYYSTNGSSWTQVETGARPGSWSGAPALIICGKGYSDNPTYSNADFDNSLTPYTNHTCKVTDIVVLPYQSTGNWESAAQTMTGGSQLLNTTITHSGLSGTEKIDEIRWQVGGVTKATYATDITTGASTTIAEGDLTSGTFADVNANFTIEIDMVGDGTASPVITQVEGTYAALGHPTVKRHQFVQGMRSYGGF